MQVAPSIIAAVTPGVAQPGSAGAAGLAELAGLGPFMGLAPEAGAEANGQPGALEGQAFAEALAASLAATQPQGPITSPVTPPAAETATTARSRIIPSVSLPPASLPETEVAGPRPDPTVADVAPTFTPITSANPETAWPTAEAKPGDSAKAKPTEVAQPAIPAAPAAAAADVDVDLPQIAAAVGRPSQQDTAPPAAPAATPPAPIQGQALAASEFQPTSAAARNLVRNETKASAQGDAQVVEETSQASGIKGPTDAAKAAFVVAPDKVEAADADAGAAADAADAPEAATKLAEAPAPATAAQPTPANAAAGPARVDHTTVPHLVSQMVQKAGAKVTRFDLELAPQGLGKVDVKVEISASGVLTAALSFDNPQAAAELRGRADELKTALQQAGFDVSDNSLNFDFNGDKQQRHAQADEDASGARAGKAFAAANDAADDLLATVAEAAARYQKRGAAGGLDIRI